MAAAKLTLSLDSRIIEEAKKYSKEKGQSLSKVIEEYLEKITEQKRRKEKGKSSIMELKGILGKASSFDESAEKLAYLKAKHK